jgi:CheY-like chemotaxis protein/HPt (histidine-containing phosphotransfer) domain-containing protein
MQITKSNELAMTDVSASVLVVEDNLLAAMSIQSFLKHLNCAYDHAENGMQALTMVQNNNYDLVLMDIGLGEMMDGIETTKQIRALNHPLVLELPIIAVTGFADDPETRAECLAAGMQGVCCKPLQSSRLEALLQQFVFKPRQQSTLPQKDEGLGSDLPESEEQLFELEQYPLLDVEKGIETLGSEATLLEILRVMVDLIPEHKAELQQAYATSDWPEIEKLVHKIKSGAQYPGTLRMEYACLHLERYRRMGRSVSLEKLYQQLIKILDATLKYIENWLKLKQ